MDIQTQLITPDSLDWSLGPIGLAEDNSLTTAVLISLFSDARVDGQRGWWGDSYQDKTQAPRDLAGSRLWLLERAKQTPQTLKDAQIYAEEALSWLLEDGLASRVDVVSSWLSPSQMGTRTAPRVLQLIITIQKPAHTGGDTESFRIDNLWSAYAV